MLMLLYAIALCAPCLRFDSVDARPLWTEQRPRQAGYWTGLGLARMTADLTETRARARTEALRDIAAQIEIGLTAETRVTQREDPDGVTGAYRSEIRTEVSGQLERVEIVDTWEDGEYFWVYARLSIAQYHQRRQQRIETARTLGAQYYQRATERENQDPAGALALYLRALESVQQQQKLHPALAAQASEIAQRIQQLLLSIELEIVPPTAQIKSGATVNIPLQIKAQIKGRPVSGLPLSCRFNRGSGDLDARVWTGADGRASAVLHRVDSVEPTPTIAVHIDLPTALPSAAPFAAIELAVARPLVHFAYAGEAALGTLLESRFCTLLSRRGFDLATGPKEADLLLELQARVNERRSFQSLRFAFLDLELALRDPRSGAAVQRSLNRIKGVGTSYEQAEASACERAGAAIAEALLPQALIALYGSNLASLTEGQEPAKK